MEPSISSKLQAEYTELANQYLDKIPVHEDKDFDKIKKALKSFLKNSEIPDCGGDNDLKGRIKTLKELIDEPEMYAREEHFGIFKQIILDRISAKISEIKQLKPNEKERLIKEQKVQKEETEQKHEIMSQSEAPIDGSEAHTVSDEQYLAELQERFIREGVPLNILPRRRGAGNQSAFGGLF